MNLDALRSLQEQASPREEDYDPRNFSVEELDAISRAYHKRAALATHLLPIAEALEAERCPYLDEGKPCSEREPIEHMCHRCKALEALKEAL